MSANPPPPPSGAGPAAPPLPPPKENVVLKMMGLPTFRPRLPSRNWLIFLSVTGSLTTAYLYDRRQARLNRQKWCDTVSHLPLQPLPSNQLPRKIRILVQAPPSDGLAPAREMFYEHVKPVLAAGALDWEVVEGRREGDVRWAVAEGIRKRRRSNGEGAALTADETAESAVAMARERAGTKEWQGALGDLVMGRHAWKEYVRGQHEGWLGPLEAPPVDEPVVETLSPEATDEEKKKAEDEEKRRKLFKPKPYVGVAGYDDVGLPDSIPPDLGPVAILPFPHILGFLNTPIRIGRFFNTRALADKMGRETAALVLASSTRDIEADETQHVLEEEEQEWHKSVRKREKASPDDEDLWKDPVALDSRIAMRLRRFALTDEDERQAARFSEKPKASVVDKDE